MTGEEVEHIRADIRQAVLEAQQHDPTVTLEILWRLFDQVAKATVAPWDAFRGSWAMTSESAQLDVSAWADWLLRDVQLRATSKLPYDSAYYEYVEPPEDHRD